MKKLIILFVALISVGNCFATASIRQYPFVKDVFETLSDLPSGTIPGLALFRYGENFSFVHPDSAECRIINSRGVIRKLSDYVEALSELDQYVVDQRLFSRQMTLILGEGEYLVCERRSLEQDMERVDTYFFSKRTDYKLWITEVFN